MDNINDIFDLPLVGIEDNEPIRMEQAEYFEKSKKIFEKIQSDYFSSFSWVRMKDEEYPNEDICDKCTGCGLFHNSNGNENECSRDKEEGECFTQIWDFSDMDENIGIMIEDIMELLYVDEITNKSEQP